MNILMINGANLNVLDKRNSDIYSNLSIEEIRDLMQKEFPEFSITSFQSNIEGEIVEALQKADENFDGIIINPGGYAHTSVAIMDALELCKIPKIEVHLSHLSKREDYRQTLLTARKTDGYISGFKENSYLAAMYLLKKILKK
ncbi:MAG: type II 3-dehydroquinate dehydratase [Ignavibacterium sp.]|nr:type II 3-dehydroquinate dehydratase [Ignavibacterium sp.]